MQKYVVEFIGTFFLVFVICLTAGQSADFTPLAIGSVLMAMVYMGGHVSGAHYNPAVTVACVVRGACTVQDAIPYIVSQIVGAIAAAFVASSLVQVGAVAPGENFSAGQALLVEILFTFALASVILNVATSKDHPNNHVLRLGHRIHCVRRCSRRW